MLTNFGEFGRLTSWGSAPRTRPSRSGWKPSLRVAWVVGAIRIRAWRPWPSHLAHPGRLPQNPFRAASLFHADPAFCVVRILKWHRVEARQNGLRARSRSAVKARARGTVRASYLAATLLCLVTLLLPALWNGYPLLQFDTGGYLARWYEGYLVPSRSTVFGLFLHLGEGLHFWPQLLLQAACTIYVISLVLRTVGSSRSPLSLIAVIAGLSLLTALPFLSAMLLTDIFAGLGVLSMHLLIFHRMDLGRYERIGLFLIIAFAAATHSATLAVLIAIWIFAVPLLLLSGSGVFSNLLPAGAALATGAAMLLAANFALSGQLAWTPGGFGIAFGRMLQDGIVKRFLDDHCPDTRLRLCRYRNELPRTADEVPMELRHLQRTRPLYGPWRGNAPYRTAQSGRVSRPACQIRACCGR